MAEIGCNWAGDLASKSSIVFVKCTQMAVVNVEGPFGLSQSSLIYIVLSRPIDGLRLHQSSISAVLDSDFGNFLDFGLDCAQGGASPRSACFRSRCLNPSQGFIDPWGSWRSGNYQVRDRSLLALRPVGFVLKLDRKMACLSYYKLVREYTDGCFVCCAESQCGSSSLSGEKRHGLPRVPFKGSFQDTI
ncbi:hypothetical protein Tco_0569290 [Tanacetum coccineum]